MKKIISFIISLFFLVGVGLTHANGDFPYDGNNDTNSTREALGVGNSDSALGKIADTYLPEATKQKNPVVFYVSKALNYFLALLAFVTFLIIVWGFSMVFTGKTDEGIKKGFKFMKMGIIVIIVIGVSWLISMFLFNIYSSGVK